MAAVEGKLYLVGGDGPVARVEVFDPAKGLWSEKAAAPVPMHHFQAVAYKEKVYVLEAFTSGAFPTQTPASNVYVYDPKVDKWTKGASLPDARKRASAGAAPYKDKLYLVAGITHGHTSGTNAMFDSYDPVANKWTALPDAPHARDHCSATVVKDKLYLVGGRNTSYHEPNNFMAFFAKTVLDVDCYDFSTKKWTTLDAKLPLGSGGGAVVGYKDRLYYMGGERATDTERNAARKDVYYLDLAHPDRWRAADSLHVGRNGMAATVLNDKIYAFGGEGGGPGGPPPPNGAMQNGAIPPPPPPPAKPREAGKPSPLEVFSLK